MNRQLIRSLYNILTEEASNIKSSPIKLPVRRRTVIRIKDILNNEPCQLASEIRSIVNVNEPTKSVRDEDAVLGIIIGRITRIVNLEYSKDLLIQFHDDLNLD